MVVAENNEMQYRWHMVGASFLTLEWEVTNKQDGEARTIRVIMNFSWRHQHELFG